jgi:2-polyprenyl-6-methoxyphenol hydroxylase-like FAD-dependent oxidoreductase
VLSEAKPEYCGISYLELHLSDVEERNPDSAALVGPGVFFALADNKALMAHGGRHIHLGASLRVPQDWTVKSGVDRSDAAGIRDILLNEFADWSVGLKDLIRHCDGTIIPRLIYALPIGHCWAHSPGVTLLGDAAHVMSPYAGEGANLAMLDATELALAIAEHGDDIETALTQYECAMFSRSKAAAEKSAHGLEMCFAADAPKGLVHFFESMGVPRVH